MEPSIIISAAGMMNAGRILHHVFNNIENPRTTILFVGYCTPNTPGGQLRNGAEEIKLFGEELKVNAKIEIMDSFSAHGDQAEMTNFLSNQTKTCRQLYMVHGEYEIQKIFRDHLHQHGFANIEIPEFKQEVTI